MCFTGQILILKGYGSLNRWDDSEIERVIDLSLEGIEVENVLDVGTGTALFAESFLRKNLKVSGIDINPEMIERV